MADYKITWDSTFRIDESVIHAQAVAIIREIFEQELQKRYSESGKAIAQAVREVVYQNKDEIIRLVIDRASREIVKKALPQFVERYNNESKT